MSDRLTANPFPAYSYVPGKWPHPRREQGGHSYGEPEPVVSQFDVNRWSDCEAYLFGIDLFNHDFYWESHEQWEAVWLAVGRKGVVADFLKGLIKLSAAGVKHLEGRPVGVQRHGKRATELMLKTTQCTQQEAMGGLELSKLIAFSQSIGMAESDSETAKKFEAFSLTPTPRRD